MATQTSEKIVVTVVHMKIASASVVEGLKYPFTTCSQGHYKMMLQLYSL